MLKYREFPKEWKSREIAYLSEDTRNTEKKRKANYRRDLKRLFSHRIIDAGKGLNRGIVQAKTIYEVKA